MKTDSSQMFSADDVTDAGLNNRNQECKQFVKLMECPYDVWTQLMYLVFSSH